MKTANQLDDIQWKTNFDVSKPTFVSGYSSWILFKQDFHIGKS